MTEQSLAASPSVQTAWALPTRAICTMFNMYQKAHISFVRGLPKNVESFSAITSSNTARCALNTAWPAHFLT